MLLYFVNRTHYQLDDDSTAMQINCFKHYAYDLAVFMYDIRIIVHPFRACSLLFLRLDWMSNRKHITVLKIFTY
jgi:hypothetical protein